MAIPLYIPELKMTVYIDKKSDVNAVRKKYIDAKNHRNSTAVPFGNRNAMCKRRIKINM